MAIVTLRNSYRYKGVWYHPGEAREIPDQLAAALGLTPQPAPLAEPKVQTEPAPAPKARGGRKAASE